MSTSEYSYRVLVDTAAVGDATHALDARTSRIVLSNLNHLADEFAQARVSMSGTVSALSGKAGYLTSRTPTAADTPYLVVSYTFPISVRALGQSYKLRVRVGGATANAAADATFRLVLSPGPEAASLVLGASDASYTSAKTSSTTAAWLTGSSDGAANYSTMVEMSASQVAMCMTEFATTESLGGDAASVMVPWATLSVFAETTNVTHVPRLYALNAAEVIGA
jgi:hypothetical protein